MAGLYIHIPFCRKACSYCDFHFSISLAQLNPMLDAIGHELVREGNYLEGEQLETIYFGGGTPSVVPVSRINNLLQIIFENYDVDPAAEISLEANPDDLDRNYLEELAGSRINRLSIGIQSFHDDDLRIMERRHDGKGALNAIQNARAAGFHNFNIDLIYGVPGLDKDKWIENLEQACSVESPHIAAYHLTFEPGTMLDHRRRKGRIRTLDEGESLEQFRVLVEMLSGAGYEHYEISNFALPGKQSRHNSSYWEGRKYLGVGPSAHSYNGLSRRWNLSGNSGYIRGIKQGIPVYEQEQLTVRDRFNEYILTSLRTSKGISLPYIAEQWGEDYRAYAGKVSGSLVQSGAVSSGNGILTLTREGMFIADHVIRELFMD